jgi:hypothetical protein
MLSNLLPNLSSEWWIRTIDHYLTATYGADIVLAFYVLTRLTLWLIRCRFHPTLIPVLIRHRWIEVTLVIIVGLIFVFGNVGLIVTHVMAAVEYEISGDISMPWGRVALSSVVFMLIIGLTFRSGYRFIRRIVSQPPDQQASRSGATALTGMPDAQPTEQHTNG